MTLPHFAELAAENAALMGAFLTPAPVAPYHYAAALRMDGGAA